MSGCGPVDERDYSNISFPGQFPQPLPTWEVGLKIGTCVLVELVALFGNLVLIAVVVRYPRMRSTTNCYIANMAVADLLIALVPMWIHVSTDIITMDSDGWPLGGFLCKFNSLVQITAMVASVLTLMAIAGDRFFAIIFPLKARVTERRVGVVLVVVWLCALSIGFPPLFFYTYKERRWKDYLETFCTDVWPAVTMGNGECDMGITSKRAYWTVVTVVLNWLPMAVMTVVYAVIIHRLRFSRVRPDAGRNSLSAIQRRSKRKVVKMLLVVLVSFMLCTIPFQVTNLYPIYSHDTIEKLPAWHRPVYYAAVFLMYTNSAINPILYGGLNENFRRGARHLLNSLLCRQDTSLGASASTHLSMSRAPRVSLVEEEARKVKVKDTDVKPSLGQLAVSAACVNTILAVKDRKDLAVTAESKSHMVHFDQNTDVIGEGVISRQNTTVVGDGGQFDQNQVIIGDEVDLNHNPVVGDMVNLDQNHMIAGGVNLDRRSPITGDGANSEQDHTIGTRMILDQNHMVSDRVNLTQSHLIAEGIISDPNDADDEANLGENQVITDRMSLDSNHVITDRVNVDQNHMVTYRMNLDHSPITGNGANFEQLPIISNELTFDHNARITDGVKFSQNTIPGDLVISDQDSMMASGDEGLADQNSLIGKGIVDQTSMINQGFVNQNFLIKEEFAGQTSMITEGFDDQNSTIKEGLCDQPPRLTRHCDQNYTISDGFCGQKSKISDEALCDKISMTSEEQ